MTPAPDPLAALVAWLKLQPDVYQRVEARVYGGALPQEVDALMPIGAIVLRPVGGVGSMQGEYGSQRFDVRCYGETGYEAFQLWLALLPTLKGLQRIVSSGCLLHSAILSAGAMSLVDPDTRWPFVLSTWQILAAEVVAV